MPREPSIAEVIRDALAAFGNQLMVATVAKVITYNPADNTLVCLPVIRHASNLAGEVDHEDSVPIPDVPVLWPRSGGYAATFPILPNDHVLLVFTHENTMMWRETGAISNPGDLRRHNLSNAWAIPGPSPMTQPLSPDVTHLAARAAGMVMGKDGGNPSIQVNELGILLGHLATMPVALAPPIMAFMAPVLAWITAAHPAIQPLLVGPQLAALNTAFTALQTAGGAQAIATVPATLVKAR